MALKKKVEFASIFSSIFSFITFSFISSWRRKRIPRLLIAGTARHPSVSVEMADLLSGCIDGLAELNKPFMVNNENFEGQVLFRSKSGPGSEQHSEYFSARRRVLEIQVQGRFKKPVRPSANVATAGDHAKQTPLLFGGELARPGPMPLGLMGRGATKLLLKTMRVMSRGNSLRASCGGKGVRPHIIFPILGLADHVVVTPDGGEDKTDDEDGAGDSETTPPALGQLEFEGIAKGERRKHPSCARLWGPESTVSFSLHSMYLDLARWRVVNVPTLPAMDLRRFWGASPIRLVLYDEVDGRRRYFINVEVPRHEAGSSASSAGSAGSKAATSKARRNRSQSMIVSSLSAKPLASEAELRVGEAEPPAPAPASTTAAPATTAGEATTAVAVATDDDDTDKEGALHRNSCWSATSSLSSTAFSSEESEEQESSSVAAGGGGAAAAAGAGANGKDDTSPGGRQQPGGLLYNISDPVRSASGSFGSECWV